MPQCSGRCCRGPMYLSASIAELRRHVDVNRSIEAATILATFRPAAADDDGHERVACAALTGTGCALAREQRSTMCNDFPYAGKRCRDCGARSDQEARGVALQRACAQTARDADSVTVSGQRAGSDRHQTTAAGHE